jgi:glycerophosphoryl diester phosphodiesterase
MIMSAIELFLLFLLQCQLLTGRADANAATTANVCQPLTLKINDKVRHRPQHLTIAHRGAAAHLPEHTLAGYRLALELGADFIEPDLLATADGQLVAMHSMDLAVATDVTTKFPNRQPWFSNRANRTGFWVFNFTAAEIATLRVYQTLPAARSEAYDGIFGIPTLTDILQTVVQWNTVDLPQRLALIDDDAATSNQNNKPTQLQLRQAGIYAELKDTVWLQEEAGIDLVQLVVQHIEQNIDLWRLQLPCFEQLQFDAFKVPGLVIQSFEPQALADFANSWKTNIADSSSNNPVIQQMPEPPYVLLVDKDQCQEESFWFQMGDTSTRELISAVGCHKDCLIANEPYTLTTIKAKEYSLEIHAWTERPEYEYVDAKFIDEVEEMIYLFCSVGIQGIFSESVSTAVLAASLPCDGKLPHNNQPENDNNNDPESTHKYCYESAEEAGFFTALAAFTMGIFVTSLFFIGYGRHCIRWQSSIVPQSYDTEEGTFVGAITTVSNGGGLASPSRSSVIHTDQEDSSEDDDHIASAVEAWRSDQLAAQNHDEGLEMT